MYFYLWMSEKDKLSLINFRVWNMRLFKKNSMISTVCFEGEKSRQRLVDVAVSSTQHVSAKTYDVSSNNRNNHIFCGYQEEVTWNWIRSRKSNYLWGKL